MKKLLMMPALAAGLWLSSAHLKADVSRWLPAAGTQAAAAGQPAPSSTDRDARMGWWRQARFGMFIHWGLYAVPAGDYKGKRSKDIGEWIMSWAQHPARRVRAVRAPFNPVKFDAARWVRTAKDAGMKYIVITSKHHDGFAMYDSDVADYDIVDVDAVQAGSDARARRRGEAAGRHVCVLLLDHGLAPSVAVRGGAGQGSDGRRRQDRRCARGGSRNTSTT